MEIGYLFSITLVFCFAYFFLYQLFSYFFENKFKKYSFKALLSLILIILISVVVHLISFNIENGELANRIKHIFAGGFLTFLTCFLIVRDSKIYIGKFQFFIFSFFIVMTLGVANEIVEYLLQNYSVFFFTDDINDTWLDLISNVLGVIIGGVTLVPFLPKESN